jgi:amyloid beta precursor protein binding protein 1
MFNPIVLIRFDAVVDSHTEELPSYRLDNAFPALLKHSVELDFDKMDVTDHGHIPYFVILVQGLHEWKQNVRQSGFLFIVRLTCLLPWLNSRKQHDGNLPAYKELKAFKEQLLAMKKKSDEENFDEAASQAFKVSRKTEVSDYWSFQTVSV